MRDLLLTARAIDSDELGITALPPPRKTRLGARDITTIAWSMAIVGNIRTFGFGHDAFDISLAADCRDLGPRDDQVEAYRLKLGATKREILKFAEQLRKDHPGLYSDGFGVDAFLLRFCFDRLPGKLAYGRSMCLYIGNYSTYTKESRTPKADVEPDPVAILGLNHVRQRELAVRLLAIDKFRRDTAKISVPLPMLGLKAQGFIRGGQTADLLLPTLQHEARSVHRQDWDIETASHVCSLSLGDHYKARQNELLMSSLQRAASLANEDDPQSEPHRHRTVYREPTHPSRAVELGWRLAKQGGNALSTRIVMRYTPSFDAYIEEMKQQMRSAKDVPGISSIPAEIGESIHQSEQRGGGIPKNGEKKQKKVLLVIHTTQAIPQEQKRALEDELGDGSSVTTTFEAVLHASNVVKQVSVAGLSDRELKEKGLTYDAAGYNALLRRDGEGATEKQREASAGLRPALVAYLAHFDQIWIAAPLNSHLSQNGDRLDEFEFAVTPDAWLGIMLMAGLDNVGASVRIRGPTGAGVEYDSPKEWYEDVVRAHRQAEECPIRSEDLDDEARKTSARVEKGQQGQAKGKARSKESEGRATSFTSNPGAYAGVFTGKKQVRNARNCT